MLDLSKLIITPEMLNLVAEIDEFKGAWQLFGRLAPTKLNRLRKMAKLENMSYGLRMDGIALSERDIELLLAYVDVNPVRSPDENVAAGYAYAYEQILNNFAHIDFSLES